MGYSLKPLHSRNTEQNPFTAIHKFHSEEKLRKVFEPSQRFVLWYSSRPCRPNSGDKIPIIRNQMQRTTIYTLKVWPNTSDYREQPAIRNCIVSQTPRNEHFFRSEMKHSHHRNYEEICPKGLLCQAVETKNLAASEMLTFSLCCIHPSLRTVVNYSSQFIAQIPFDRPWTYPEASASDNPPRANVQGSARRLQSSDPQGKTTKPLW